MYVVNVADRWKGR